MARDEAMNKRGRGMKRRTKIELGIIVLGFIAAGLIASHNMGVAPWHLVEANRARQRAIEAKQARAKQSAEARERSYRESPRGLIDACIEMAHGNTKLMANAKSLSWLQLLSRSELAYRAARFDEAGQYAGLALEQTRPIPATGRNPRSGMSENTGYGLSVAALAKVYGAQGRYPEAKVLYGEALAYARVDNGADDTAKRSWPAFLPLESVERAHVLLDKQEFNMRTHEPPNVRELADAVARITYRFGERSIECANAQRQLAQGQLIPPWSDRNRQPMHVMWQPLIRALKVQQKQGGDKSADAGLTLRILAALYLQQGNHERAGALFTQARTVLLESFAPDHPIIAHTWHQQGLCFLAEGDHESALDALTKATKAYERIMGPAHHQVAVVKGDLARTLRKAGRYGLAQQHLRDAMNMLVDAAGVYSRLDRELATELYMVYMDICLEVQDYDEVIAMNEQMPFVSIAKYRSGDANATNRIEEMLATAYVARGRHADAIVLLERLTNMLRIRLSREAPSHHQTSHSNEDKPSASGRISTNWSPAPAVGQRVHTAHVEKWGDPRSGSEAGDDRVWRPVQRVTMVQRLDYLTKPQQVRQLELLAECYRRVGRHADAQALTPAIARWRQTSMGTDQNDPVTIGLFNAGLAMAAGRWSDMLDSLVEVLPARAEHRRVLMATGTTEQDGESTWLDATIWHAIIGTALRAKPDSPKAPRVAMNALLAFKASNVDALIQAQKIARTGGDAQILALADEVAATRRELSAVLSQEPDPGVPTVHPRRIQELRGHLAALEHQLAQRTADTALHQAGERVTWQQIAARLPADTALITYLRLHDFTGDTDWAARPFYVAMTLRRNQAPRLYALHAYSDWDYLARRLARQLRQAPALINELGEQEAESQLRETAEQLTGFMLVPLWEDIKDARRWLVSLDGQLQSVPLAVLPIPLEDRYIIDDYDIAYINSGRDVMQFAASQAPDGKAVVIANPDFDLAIAPQAGGHLLNAEEEPAVLEHNRLNPLPGTEVEGEAIAQLMRDAGIEVDLFTQQHATKRRLLSLDAPRYLHIATHGYFIPNENLARRLDPFVRVESYRDSAGRLHDQIVEKVDPLLFGGLALSSANVDRTHGVATALDMLGMNLWGTQLVVLSACQTGLGEATTGSGVRGLQLSFLQSGTRSLVMSLWNVPDAETAELMQSFYRYLLAGEPRSQALQAAMIDVRTNRRQNNQGMAHPLYWGAFVLMGDPGYFPANPN